jgi:hypothetical protein
MLCYLPNAFNINLFYLFLFLFLFLGMDHMMIPKAVDQKGNSSCFDISTVHTKCLNHLLYFTDTYVLLLIY